MSATFKKTLDSSASSLALSPDCSQVVIAGSHIFKIFSIEENDLTEKVNLYAAKNLNPLFSSSDVVWNPIEENKIATVANNGAIVTWDLSKSTRSKLDKVYKEHERPVNKISYHPQKPHLLISGDKDGIMKLFDTRQNEAVTTFISNAESVRDIQFSPHVSNYFAAGTENGNVQFWDMRRSDRTEQQFTGHGGPVFALDWHPEDRRWIATAGRDHTIKVWTWDVDEPYSIYKSIKTVASVGRVKWRPNKTFHLASCALAIDCSINVWDIRRPYIPFSVFAEHRDVTTGIAWQGNCQVLLSVGKDNTLYCHSFDDATHPIENTNPVGLNMNPQGLISHTKPIDDHAVPIVSPGKHAQNKPSQNLSISSDSFVGPVFSSLNIFNTDIMDSPTSATYIIEFARCYRLTGRSFNEICEHNAAAAKRLNKLQIAQTWQILQTIYGGDMNFGTLDYSQNFLNTEDVRTDIVESNEQKPSSRHISGETLGDSGVISGEDAETETDDPDNPGLNLLNIASGETMNYDFFFGDELSQINFDYDNLNNLESCHEWTLPNEAFQPRREITYQPTTPPEDFSSNTSLPNTNKEELQLNEDTRGNHQYDYMMCASLKLLDPTSVSSDPFDYGPIVVDMLNHYASTGDVQMAVTLLIVLGERIRSYLDENVIEHWFLSYIEILHKLNLWNTATLIIKHATFLPQIQQLNQQSTAFRIQCGSCDSPISYGKQFCGKCGNIPTRCSICHQVVKGLFVWCQGCSHGGHLNHIMEWMQDSPSCPTGCGHYCEYT